MNKHVIIEKLGQTKPEFLAYPEEIEDFFMKKVRFYNDEVLVEFTKDLLAFLATRILNINLDDPERVDKIDEMEDKKIKEVINDMLIALMDSLDESEDAIIDP